MLHRGRSEGETGMTLSQGLFLLCTFQKIPALSIISVTKGWRSPVSPVIHL
ncbi:hypothetical protein ES703_16815 [subsurface metagenome]